VYGPDLAGEVGPDTPYGTQSDLSHLSKIYAEQCLQLYARRAGFDLSLLRLGIVYGPSPVEHARAESQTVVDKFKRLAATGEELPLDDGGRATIGVVHVEDAARILLESPRSSLEIENVVAETTTVAEVAALARGEPAGAEPAWKFSSPFDYRHWLKEYL
jgi:nucleoside-diphosphate-sugar epimerase